MSAACDATRHGDRRHIEAEWIDELNKHLGEAVAIVIRLSENCYKKTKALALSGSALAVFEAILRKKMEASP
jgi:hypothetical protein